MKFLLNQPYQKKTLGGHCEWRKAFCGMGQFGRGYAPAARDDIRRAAPAFFAEIVRFGSRREKRRRWSPCMNAGAASCARDLRGLLWATTSESLARRSLSRALSEARKAFGDGFIQTDGQAIWVDAAQVWVDAIELPRLPTERHLSSLDRAEVLYQGDFLAFGELNQEKFDDWLLGERERQRQIAQRGHGGSWPPRQRHGRRAASRHRATAFAGA